jgi:hypothetical protein
MNRFTTCGQSYIKGEKIRVIRKDGGSYAAVVTGVMGNQLFARIIPETELGTSYNTFPVSN